MFIESDFEFDRRHIWHPYTSISNPLPCYPITTANGCQLHMADGRELIDGMSSWWAAIHGYNHPRLNKALHRQISQMSHVMFGGITHPSAIELCRTLLLMTPEPLECVFLADSGSIAVEVSMKMALQYWLGRGKIRKQFLVLKNGYHGDTFAAMSVCDPKNSMHNMWDGYLFKHLFANSPQCTFGDNWKEEDFLHFAQLADIYHNNIAAVLLEPIVQGVGGMRFYHPYYLRKVRELCDEYGFLLIADEIATGFGRTGKFFACEHSDVIPDILCLGKALTGGMMTLSTVLTTREVADTIGRSASGCLMHGPTFMGNPLACAVALENLIILNEGNWIQQVINIEKRFRKDLLPIRNHPLVIDTRVLGAIGVIETRYMINIAAIQRFFIDCGVWIRPFKNLIYLIPPYLISSIELIQLINSIKLALDIEQHFKI